MTLHLSSDDVNRDRVDVNIVVKLASINCCLASLLPTAAVTRGNTCANTRRFARINPAGVGICLRKKKKTGDTVSRFMLRFCPS